MELFEKYGVFDYIREFYDVLHTTGYQYINHDIDLYLEGAESGSTGVTRRKRAFHAQKCPRAGLPRKEVGLPGAFSKRSGIPHPVPVLVGVDALQLFEGSGKMGGIGIAHHFADLADFQAGVFQ